MYEVTYSERVIELLREMIARNPAHATQILAALREIDRRLRIYPQFGQPLRDLSVDRARLWVATLPPLVIQYILVEGDANGQGRQVTVVRPITPLPRSGIV